MKKIIHDKWIVLLLVLATAITVSMVFLQYRYSAVLNYKTVEEQAGYNVLYWIYSMNLDNMGEDIIYEEQEAKIYKKMEFPEISGNFILKDCTEFKVPNSFDIALADVYLQYNEIPIWKLESGRYPTIDEVNSGKRVAVVGDEWLPYVNQKGKEKYIKLSDEEYEVTGVFENKNAIGTDNRLFLFFDTLSSPMQQKILYYMNEVRTDIFYECDKEEDIDYERILTKWIKREQPQCSASIISANGVDEEDNSIDEVTEMIYSASKYMALLIYIFGIISCLSISKIWASRRTKEFMIRMAHGESKLHIGMGLAVWLLVLQVVGILLAACITVLFLSDINLILFIKTSGIGLLIETLAIFVCTVGVPFALISKLSIAQGLQKW